MQDGAVVDQATGAALVEAGVARDGDARADGQGVGSAVTGVDVATGTDDGGVARRGFKGYCTSGVKTPGGVALVDRDARGQGQAIEYPEGATGVGQVAADGHIVKVARARNCQHRSVTADHSAPNHRSGKHSPCQRGNVQNVAVVVQTSVQHQVASGLVDRGQGCRREVVGQGERAARKVDRCRAAPSTGARIRADVGPASGDIDGALVDQVAGVPGLGGVVDVPDGPGREGDSLVGVVTQPDVGGGGPGGLHGDATADGQAGVGGVAVELGVGAREVQRTGTGDAGVAHVLQVGVVADGQGLARRDVQPVGNVGGDAGVEAGVDIQVDTVQGAPNDGEHKARIGGEQVAA